MDTWSNCCIKVQKSSLTSPSFMQVVEGLFSKCNLEEIAQFVGLTRCIWLRRNEVIHSGIFSHPNKIVQMTLKAIDKFNLAQGRESR
jgi:hypothetical protein